MRYGTSPVQCHRQLATLSKDPVEIVTSMLGTPDPKRDSFFKYTWGTWLHDDIKQKALRETRFSIEGLVRLIENLHETRVDLRYLDKSNSLYVRSPVASKDGSSFLTHNLKESVLGEVGKTILIKSVASVHEGKHNRIYKVSLSTGKELILRIPYSLDLAHATELKIQSEVATMDFLDLKVKAAVPRVLAYSANKANALESPYILMEYIAGDLLMKQWDPLAIDSTESEGSLLKVIDPISKFHSDAIAIEFSRSGSLYFFENVLPQDQAIAPYENEGDDALKNRWRIGPSIERPYARKSQLLSKQISQYNGPFQSSDPMKVVSALADLELENAQTRLALVTSLAGGPDTTAKVATFTEQVKTFKALSGLGESLLNPQSKAIINAQPVFSPRLYLPDLDPLNVIVHGDVYTFFDFEYSCIKPFVLASYPTFVAYQGAKIYDAETEVDGFAEMDEVEMQQYRFMQYKTRNERLWELALNKRHHDLIAVASPYIKSLRSPYDQCLEMKTDQDYLYVKGAIIQLEAVWDQFAASDLCLPRPDIHTFSPSEIETFHHELARYQQQISSTPFAATGGWVPQDMFDNLREQGMIVQNEDGDWQIETEKVLE